VINIVFDDEYLRQIAELMITGFLGWMSLQPEAEKMLAAFERVMNALDQEHVEPTSHIQCQEAYDAACWLSSIAANNDFGEMGGVFDAVASRFSHTLSAFGYDA